METLNVYLVVCDSKYTAPEPRIFEVEDTDPKAAREFAETCLCAGKERIRELFLK